MALNIDNQSSRYIIAFFSVVILISICIHVYNFEEASGPHDDLTTTPFNDAMMAAVELHVQLSRDLFQITLVYIAGIWGLLIAKKGEAVLVFGDKPEMIMAGTAASLLSLSITMHILYLAKVTEVYRETAEFIAKMPQDIPANIANIFADSIDYLFVAQYWFLGVGAFVSLVTFVSAHIIKKDIV